MNSPTVFCTEVVAFLHVLLSPILKQLIVGFFSDAPRGNDDILSMYLDALSFCMKIKRVG